MSNFIFNRIDEGLHHDKPRFLESPRKHTQDKCLQKPNPAGIHDAGEPKAHIDQQQLKTARSHERSQEPLQAPGK
jgi:hypothetical protein